MRNGSLRRRLATVMSVVGVLAVGTAAAAVNVRLLHSASSEPARLAVQTTGGMTVMNPSTAATPSASATPATTPAPTASATPSATASAASTAAPLSQALRTAPTRSAAARQPRTVTAADATRPTTAPQPVTPAQPPAPRPIAPPTNGAPQPLPGVAGPAGGGDDGDGEHRDGTHREGTHRDRLPQLTVDQMNVLRIAAMAHVRPDVVIAAAKGDPTVDAATLATIQQVAQYIGVDLTSLAKVTSVPRLGDRWHGNPNDNGGTNSDY